MQKAALKLLSTHFVGENSIELTYADDPRLEDATTFLHVRLQRPVEQSKSLAWTRYHALDDLQTVLQRLKEHERQHSPGL